MSQVRNHVQHYYSINSGSTPTVDNMYLGEIAVNAAYGSEALFIKNQKFEKKPIFDSYNPYAQGINGYEQIVTEDIVTFKPREYFEEIIIENEAVTAAALIDLDKRVKEVKNNQIGRDEFKKVFGHDIFGGGYISVISCGTF